ncbi:unnamed protein product [Ranitomeya imitator]|uniref:Uncharacterized protein n=1 Tax=Ranitomeya imitator TaxID=111125 RepID=A0ABN9L813_9NEOB|nr:unnamed protein product [Ranitomeya imitator]
MENATSSVVRALSAEVGLRKKKSQHAAYCCDFRMRLANMDLQRGTRLNDGRLQDYKHFHVFNMFGFNKDECWNSDYDSTWEDEEPPYKMQKPQNWHRSGNRSARDMQRYRHGYDKADLDTADDPISIGTNNFSTNSSQIFVASNDSLCASDLHSFSIGFSGKNAEPAVLPEPDGVSALRVALRRFATRRNHRATVVADRRQQKNVTCNVFLQCCVRHFRPCMRVRNSTPTSPQLTMGQRMRWKNASAAPIVRRIHC